MDLAKAFDDLQGAVNADPKQVALGRDRRDVFIASFETLDGEVTEAKPSGSLARGTQLGPIKDVDVFVVFDPTEHPDWGAVGGSAADALSYTGAKVNELLGITNGSHYKLVRLASPRNHAVKCFLDDPGDKDGFTVDVMPALRQAGGELLIPEARNEQWVRADPEYLIRVVADRQEVWDQFVPLVRVLKFWAREQDSGIKSLVIEVLALSYLTEQTTRGHSLAKFFAAASANIHIPVVDPAGLCGTIQPDLDVSTARAALSRAADAANRAINAADRGETDEAACLWRAVFGNAFPEPDGGCTEPPGTAGATAAVAALYARPRKVKDSPQG